MASGHADERPLTVVQTGDGVPHAMVFAGPRRARSTAQTKRDRYVLNLRQQYAHLKEALSAAEQFFVVCQVDRERLDAVRKAHADALDDLSARFQAKINEYDRRIERGS
ncbi:MAG: hypothetical protein WC728_03800 [Elusimicrobiota bacterium]